MKYDPYSPLSSALSWMETVTLAVFAVIFMFTFVFRIVTVQGQSMEKTLFEGDRLIVAHLWYSPQRGDIVVADSSAMDQVILKRVIAVSNDVVEINYDEHTVSVNGSVIDEPYIAQEMEDTGGFVLGHDERQGVYRYDVPFGYVFLMGDNRNHSTDSRVFGAVSQDELLGKVVYRFFSKESGIGRVG